MKCVEGLLDFLNNYSHFVRAFACFDQPALPSCIKFSDDDMKILDEMKDVLKEHEVEHRSNPDHPEVIYIELIHKEKTFNLEVSIEAGMISLILSFPFRVQANAISLMSLYLTEINKEKTYPHFNLNIPEGKITISYSYLCDHPERFYGKAFWFYILSMMQAAADEYDNLKNISTCIVPKQKKRIYEYIMAESLKSIDQMSDGVSVQDDEERLKELYRLFGPGKVSIRDKKVYSFEHETINQFFEYLVAKGIDPFHFTED